MKIQLFSLLWLARVNGFTSPFSQHHRHQVPIVPSDRVIVASLLSGHRHDNHHHTVTRKEPWRNTLETTLQRFVTPMATAVLVFFLSCSVASAADFAKKDISGKDFSGQDLAGKDFTGAIAKNANFHNANLQGAIFTKASLEKADFSGANVKSANFVDAVLDGTSFKDAVAEKATFSNTILDVGDLENVDLTDSMWPSILRIMICDMPEIKGVNPTTGMDSRDSIMCTDITQG